MIRRIALAAVLSLLLGSPADAQLPGVAVCSMSATGVNFGTVMGGAQSGLGELTLRCTGLGVVSYNIELSTGNSLTYRLREMANGRERLGYNIYTEASLGTVWGNGLGSSQTVSGSIRFSGQPLVIVAVPVRARISNQSAPTPGAYLDTIVASLRYGGNRVDTAFDVTANEVPSCNVSATNLAFGTYNDQRGSDAESEIDVTCTRSTPWTVGLSQGTSPGATVTTRKMTRAGGGTLSYDLFRNAARTQNWGNTVGIDTESDTGTGRTQSLRVFGRVPAAQSVGGGAYQDTIIVTLTF